MPTLTQISYLVSVEEQSQFEKPIKINWHEDSEARWRVLEQGVHPLIEDEAETEETWCDGVSYRCFQRQKTNIVVKTVEEARELFSILERYEFEHGGVWQANPSMRKSVTRVRDMLEIEIEKRGFELRGAHPDYWLIRVA